jgi:hypothetical protein
LAAVLSSRAEVQADRLGMAQVEPAVWLGRKAGRHSRAIGPLSQVLFDLGADEVQIRLAFSAHGFYPLPVVSDANFTANHTGEKRAVQISAVLFDGCDEKRLPQIHTDKKLMAHSWFLR